MKIACFGASVTAQGKGNGYVDCLSKKFDCDVKKFGYGAQHLCCAGICYIDDVLKCNPDICFVDWFSSAYIDTDNDTIDYLNTIVYKFSKSNCKLVFLFLPRSDHDNRIDFYSFLKDYLISKKLFYVDINEYVKHNDKISRDIVHTTPEGAELYADIIYDVYKKSSNKITIPTNYAKTIYCDIKKLDISKIFKKYMIIDGECEIITCGLTIGPNSGYIKINNYDTKILLWDKHCHYDRSACNLSKIMIKGETKFEVLQDIVDYSSCTRDYDFSNVNFELNIKNIYYIGRTLKVIDGN